jgi:hypothetical protein
MVSSPESLKKGKTLTENFAGGGGGCEIALAAFFYLDFFKFDLIRGADRLILGDLNY